MCSWMHSLLQCQSSCSSVISAFDWYQGIYIYILVELQSVLYQTMYLPSMIPGSTAYVPVLELYMYVYCKSFRFILLHIQLPQLPLTSRQSRKVPLLSESLGPHPLHWEIQLGTGSTIVVEAVAVWMLVVVPQTTTL